MTLLVLVLARMPALAATYYVDPAAGSNTNAGTSAGAPWRNPPGTRTANNSGFYSSAWGSITTANKVACGDLILLKGGATQTSAQGGGWLIDSNYYAAGCTSGARLTIRVATAAEWAGSSAAFTLNGSGITPIPGSCFGSHSALIQLCGRDYVSIGGASATQRLVVTNSTAFGIVVTKNGGPPNVGFRAAWLELADSAYAFNIGNTTAWQVSDSIGHHIKWAVWQTGLNVDQTHGSDGAFVRCTAYDSGCGSVAAPSCTNGAGQSDLFFFAGGTDMWCIDCTAYNGGERGVNSGVIGNPNQVGPWSFRFRNLVSYNNGRGPSPCAGGGPHYCLGAGADVSGAEFVDSDVAWNYVLGAVIWGNSDAGLGAYLQGALEVWNATTYNTNVVRSLGSYLIDSTAAGFNIINSIDQRATSSSLTFGINNSNGAAPQRTFAPIALSSCFRPLSANSETLGLSGWPGAGTYASPPSWIGPSNKTTLTTCDPKFVATSTSNFAGNDFHLQATSTAIDAGRFYLLANGAGTNAQTITVKANGGSGDPRNFFIAPNSYLDATPDTIQIQGCGRVSITGMTATTISFTPACSWAANAGIHLPWTGSAPDMGAFEFGLGSTVQAPTLLSVEVVTP